MANPHNTPLELLQAIERANMLLGASVRVGTTDDLDAIAQTVAESFVDYNWTVETIQADGRFERLRSIHRLFIERVVLPKGLLLVVEDSRGVVTAVSMWDYPTDTTPQNPILNLTGLNEEIAALAGTKHQEFFAFDEWLDPYQPKEPGYYLGSLAVHPDYQGRGLARAVLEPVFIVADKQGYPIHLDTSTQQNRAMYEHFGFAVTAEVTMPDDVFTSYLMTRSPR